MRKSIKNSLYAFLVAVAALIGVSTVNPAHAVIVVLPEFEILETAGSGYNFYTVINNSNLYPTPEYIYGFSVTNPSASIFNDWTTEHDWAATKTPLIGRSKTGFAYATFPGFFSFSFTPLPRHIVFHVDPDTIGPGESSSNFFFGPAVLASTGTLFLVDGNGNFSTHSLETTVSAVPELSTWAMLLLGFAGIGFIAQRRRRNSMAVNI